MKMLRICKTEKARFMIQASIRMTIPPQKIGEVLGMKGVECRDEKKVISAQMTRDREGSRVLRKEVNLMNDQELDDKRALGLTADTIINVLGLLVVIWLWIVTP
jgi:hypothetical protein